MRESISGKDLKEKLTTLGRTPFAIEVLLETARIPKGQTRSYSDIAKAIGRPRAIRAVGTVLKKNPYPGETIPCHRVIHKDGRVVGFLGSMNPKSKENQKKRALLKFEAALVRD